MILNKEKSTNGTPKFNLPLLQTFLPVPEEQKSKTIFCLRQNIQLALEKAFQLTIWKQPEKKNSDEKKITAPHVGMFHKERSCQRAI